MATSGTSTFQLNVADTIEEAFERIGIEVRSGYESKSARRSLNLMLQDWTNRQINLWKLKLTTQPLVQGTTSYTLTANILDISDVVLNRKGLDTTMHRLSRSEYQRRPNKSVESRPSQFWIERTDPVVMHVYPAPENSTDSVKYYAMERIEDITLGAETIDIPSRFSTPVVSGLSYYLALKYKPTIVPLIKQIYDEDLKMAMDEDRERVSLHLIPQTRGLV